MRHGISNIGGGLCRCDSCAQTINHSRGTGSLCCHWCLQRLKQGGVCLGRVSLRLPLANLVAQSFSAIVSLGLGSVVNSRTAPVFSDSVVVVTVGLRVLRGVVVAVIGGGVAV